MGMLCGLTVSSVIFCIFFKDYPEFLERQYVYVIAVVTTIITATLTMFGILKSIDTQISLSQNNKDSKLRAAKIFLPVALSDICRHSQYGMDFALREEHHRGEMTGADFLSLTEPKLTFQEETISILRDISENEIDRDVQDRISMILKEYQVAKARWRSHLNDDTYMIDTEFNRRERVVHFAYIYALSSSLFDYARNEKKIEAVEDWSISITEALRLTHIKELREEDFGREIKLYGRKSD